MKSMRSKFLMPVLAITLAISASAFTAIDEPKAAYNTLITGYINSPTPCFAVQVDCGPDGTQECTYGSEYVFDLNGATGCNKPLYQRTHQ